VFPRVIGQTDVLAVLIEQRKGRSRAADFR
jgi:hypothetical protein